MRCDCSTVDAAATARAAVPAAFPATPRLAAIPAREATAAARRHLYRLRTDRRLGGSVDLRRRLPDGYHSMVLPPSNDGEPVTKQPRSRQRGERLRVVHEHLLSGVEWRHGLQLFMLLSKCGQHDVRWRVRGRRGATEAAGVVAIAANIPRPIGAYVVEGAASATATAFNSML